MSGKRTGWIVTGVILSVIGLLAVAALVILSVLFYPPGEWPEGPPDVGPMIGIIVNLCLGCCCLIGPLLVLIGLFSSSSVSRKKKSASGKKASKKSSQKEKHKKG